LAVVEPAAPKHREEQPVANKNAAHKTANKKKIAVFLFISTSSQLMILSDNYITFF